jgi:hypothetical protein
MEKEVLVWDAFNKEIKFLELKKEQIEQSIYDDYVDLTVKLQFLNYDKVSCEIHKDVQIIFKFKIDNYIVNFKFYGDLTKFYFSLFKFTKRETFELITFDGDIDRSNLDYYVEHMNNFFHESRDENR